MPIRRRIRQFLGDTGASMSIEAAIMAPTLIFALFLMFTIFDIFRYDATNSKAAFTIGDLLSRETDPVDQEFVDGMKDIFDYMTNTDAATWLRVSVVRYDGDDEELKLVWSHGNTGTPALTDETFSTITDSIPDMAEEDTVIVVETYMPYQMPFRVGLRGFAFKNTVITRPRFSSQLVWQAS
jgi:hypothetical protein